MKIAMIGQKNVPSRIGGIEVVVTTLATKMADLGHEIFLYNRKVDDESSFSLNNKNIHIKQVFTIKGKGVAAFTSSFFATIASLKDKCDIYHYHAEGPALFCFIPKLFNKKVVVTIHGLDWKRKKWNNLANKIIKLGEKTAVKYADEIIVLTKSNQKYFKDIYSKDTIYIPNGIDEPNAIFDSNNNYLLFVGRIVPEKGIHYLIEAFNKVKDHPYLKDKYLYIVGKSSDSNDYYNNLKEITKDDERIKMLGFKQGNELTKLFSNAYLYILPSEIEGMPISLLEAMSYSNCCIVSDTEEFKEIVEDKAITFKCSNVDDLSNKLITDPQIISKYKENSKNYILNKYKWDDIVKSTLKTYENIINK